MRISSAALALMALAGCSSEPDGASRNAARGQVMCALNGAINFARNCMMERTAGADGLVLTMRHPDGGFRKLVVTKDGRGVIAADGAEPARVRVTGDREIEVAVAGDRYRLPATVKGKPLRP